jgi:DNA-directed RNA polymerase specialized sigma24 family protein
MRKHIRKHVPLDAATGCAAKDELLAERREISEIVASALACMPQREREAVRAYSRMSEESCRQVANRHGVSVQTVCNWAKAGITRLRPKLEGCL